MVRGLDLFQDWFAAFAEPRIHFHRAVNAFGIVRDFSAKFFQQQKRFIAITHIQRHVIKFAIRRYDKLDAFATDGFNCGGRRSGRRCGRFLGQSRGAKQAAK